MMVSRAMQRLRWLRRRTKGGFCQVMREVLNIAAPTDAVNCFSDRGYRSEKE
jgi:hypothetical protein